MLFWQLERNFRDLTSFVSSWCLICVSSCHPVLLTYPVVRLGCLRNMQISTSSEPVTGNTASVCFCSHPSVGNPDRHMVQLGENVSMSTGANFKRAHNWLWVGVRTALMAGWHLKGHRLPELSSWPHCPFATVKTVAVTAWDPLLHLKQHREQILGGRCCGNELLTSGSRVNWSDPS